MDIVRCYDSMVIGLHTFLTCIASLFLESENSTLTRYIQNLSACMSSSEVGKIWLMDQTGHAEGLYLACIGFLGPDKLRYGK